MNIRKGNPEDMKAVLGLIQELAIFEKEPDAVVVTEEESIAAEVLVSANAVGTPAKVTVKVPALT